MKTNCCLYVPVGRYDALKVTSLHLRAKCVHIVMNPIFGAVFVLPSEVRCDGTQVPRRSMESVLDGYEVGFTFGCTGSEMQGLKFG